jgi:sterol desaturase/sphingolipid hydroxylase (fatty acid hydroxylase superfamily)
MLEGFLTNAAETYAYAYFGSVLVVALVEWAVPRRTPADMLGLRWSNNFAISLLNTLIVRAAFPVATIAWATLCAQHGWGLLNAVNWPSSIGVLVTVVALDLVVYTQHYLLHRIPMLWRLHRTHHSDADYDFTTAVRFHPLEAMFTAAVQLGAIYALGAPPAAVFLSQVLALLASFAEHANVRIPGRVDRVLRTVFVTPDVHRIHHSQIAGESRSNFANLFSWWDRLFGTYIDQPAAGHAGIQFGLPEFTARKHATIPWMLAQPFLPESDAASVARTLSGSRGEPAPPTPEGFGEARPTGPLSTSARR